MTGAGTPEATSAVHALPARWYTDPAVLKMEQERIFRRSWHYVGRAADVREPGEYFAAQAGDVPVVVVRDRSGRLNAFVNVCRHRLSEVVRGAGRSQTLRCPYHSWTYDLDGSLRSAPRAEREGVLEREELGLLPIQVDVWGPLVFVNSDLEAPPLAQVLGDVPALVETAGVDVDRLDFRLRAESELAANWKVAVENYLECYHCPVAHRAFSEVVDVAPSRYRLGAKGLVFTQSGPVRSPLPADGGPSTGRRHGGCGEITESQFHLVWPSFRVNVFPGPANLSVGPLLPAGPERTFGFLDYFFPPDVPDEAAEALLALDEGVGREDRDLVESVQRGLSSGMVERGRLLPESEQLVARFQALLTTRLSEEGPIA